MLEADELARKAGLVGGQAEAEDAEEGEGEDEEAGEEDGEGKKGKKGKGKGKKGKKEEKNTLTGGQITGGKCYR